MAYESRFMKFTLLICCFTMLYFGILATQNIVTKKKQVKDKTLTSKDPPTKKIGHVHHSPTTKAPGSADIRSPFRHLVLQSGKPYIDKTGFILEVLTGSQEVAIFRPRQCGKTVNLDMVAEFLRIDGDSTDVFLSNFTVMRKIHKNFRDKFMNRVPVVFVNLADVDACVTFEKAKQVIQRAIMINFDRYSYIRDELEDRFKQKFDSYYNSKLWKEDDLVYALVDLCQLVSLYLRKLPVLIVDEIDAPVAGASRFDYEESMINFMRQFTPRSFKTNPYCNQVIVAGVVPIPLYLPSSVLICDISKRIFDSHFGLIKPEVDNLQWEYGGDAHPNLGQDLSMWYNHFYIGGEKIYNPKSVVDCCFSKWHIQKYRSTGESVTNLTLNLLTGNGVLPALNLQALISNVTLRKQVNADVYFPHVFNHEPNLWGVLIHAGLISVENPVTDLLSVEDVKLKIPGEETKLLLEGILKPLVKAKRIPDYTKFTEFVEEWNEKEVFKWMKKYVDDAGSYLYHKGEEPSPKELVEYVKLIMAQWTSLYGSNITVGEQRWNELPFSFHDTDGDLRMEFSVKIQPGVWENVRTSFLNPFREKVITKLPRMALKLLKAYAKKKIK